MKKPLTILLCVGLFGAGLAIGRAEDRNASTWNSHSEIEQLMWVNGYQEGYAIGSGYGIIAEAGTLAEKDKRSATLHKLDPARLARLKLAMRDQIGQGTNKHINTMQIQDGITAFYGDFRNQGVCWRDAFKFAAMSMNGDTPTEEELQTARKTDANSGCNK